MESLLKKIFRYSTIGPALTRFYIISHVKLHRIHSSDAEFHTHPWNGISFILGSYHELHETDKVPRRKVLFNTIRAHKAHRVIITKPVWTLFINFRRINEHWYYGLENKPWEGSDQERSLT